MSVKRILAGAAGADVDAAVPWSERLFGRPPDALPMQALAEWHLHAGGVSSRRLDAGRGGAVAGGRWLGGGASAAGSGGGFADLGRANLHRSGMGLDAASGV